MGTSSTFLRIWFLRFRFISYHFAIDHRFAFGHRFTWSLWRCDLEEGE
jgi:hypothetical protein